MGTKPITRLYEPGSSCIHCSSVIFDGNTPKYVEVLVAGVTACPAAGPLTPPDGVKLLTQIAVCSWLLMDAGIAYQWTLTATNSNFVIAAHPIIWFSHTIASICQSQFTNQLSCGPSNIFGTNGTSSLFWGPTIGP